MEAEQVVKIYLDNEGEELLNPEEKGKAVELDNVLYREGENLKAIILNSGGMLYTGIMSKPTKKEFTLTDEMNIGHVIKYELIEKLEKL